MNKALIFHSPVWCISNGLHTKEDIYLIDFIKDIKDIKDIMDTCKYIVRRTRPRLCCMLSVHSADMMMQSDSNEVVAVSRDDSMASSASLPATSLEFPLSRVKRIMKADKSVPTCQNDAVIAASAAAVSRLLFSSPAK